MGQKLRIKILKMNAEAKDLAAAIPAQLLLLR